MSKRVKIWLIAAALLVVTGLIIFSAAMFAQGWDLTKLNSVRYETNRHDIGEKFSDISVTTETADVILLPSDDGRCTVVAYEPENAVHTVSVQNGTLNIKVANTRHWYENITFFSIGAPKITVYLPENEYDSIAVRTNTGDVDLPKDFSFGKIKVSTDTGDVSSVVPSAGSMTVVTDTGNINISTAKFDGKVDIETDTGRVRLSRVDCGSLDIESDTGDVTLSDVISDGRFSVENDTGDVRFERSDAAEIFVETETGDVTGTLLSEKVFIVKTDTGDVDVPRSVTGGRCEITTDTGDVELNIAG